MRVLAGDIGGTNARLAVVEVSDAETRLVHERRFATHAFAALADMVHGFRPELDAPPERACFGIAGRVIDGQCHGPNLPWPVNEPELAAAIGVPTTLVNDFTAVGYGLGRLGVGDLETLQQGKPVEHGVVAVIGAGTGLGEGFLVWDGTRYRAQASEGGHVDFAPADHLEWQLRQSLQPRFGHVSYERVASGPGLVDIYRHLAARGNTVPEAAMVRAEMRGGDPAAVIVRHAVACTDALCVQTLDLFVSVLGAQAGNLALTVLALGGVYVAGGIAPRIVANLKAGPFLVSFRSKGRLSDVVARVPVHVVMNPNVGLFGAAAVAAGVA